MQNVLHITNGDSAVTVMQRAGIQGTFLPWRDVLHIGPVPQGLNLDELSLVRADFIAGQGWGEQEVIRKSFQNRDAMLRASATYDKILLWFEHDLYDQLQLAQLLDWYADNTFAKTPLHMICTDHYLGMASSAELQGLHKYEQKVSRKQLTLGKDVWQAFRASSPEPLQKLLGSDTSSLPFMKNAIQRLLKEYPDCENGLSRTAQTALTVIADGVTKPGLIFAAYQEKEEAKFMGDLTFYAILQEMLYATPPLLVLASGSILHIPPDGSQILQITEAGKQVMEKKRNWFDSMSMDHWIGGVHLRPGNMWCYNTTSKNVQKIS